MLISNLNSSSSSLPYFTNSLEEKDKSIPLNGPKISLNTFNDFSGGPNFSKKSLSSNVLNELGAQGDIFSLLNGVDNNEDKQPQNDYIVHPQSYYSGVNGLTRSPGNSLTSNNNSLSSSFSNILPPFDEIFSFESKFKNLVDNWASVTESSPNISLNNQNDEKLTSNTTALNFDLRWVQ